MIIKVFLIASVAMAGWWLLRSSGGRQLAATRLGGLLFAASWVTAVMAPDLVSRVANLMGVGRGTDLVLYLLVVAFLFSSIAQRQRLRTVEERLATVARSQALLELELARRTDERERVPES
ncbi:DUF2304 domain-containing protein [Nocardioides sp. SOB77]|uniref:DUF2304 domain-containing protein n=1 Tax=Nocardioides oceani TaxID=3058369 RepID=A0ABT8FE46_9ACTN|nr:DUF2304 domain-containing protein [Nocardioides oceani]MDN4172957.1 DUF2304 domain-containing protein [Nocardioides oceani]